MEHEAKLANERHAADVVDHDAPVTKLRRVWRWQDVFAVLTIAGCIFFVGAMNFAGRPAEVPPPTPGAVQSAWQELVSGALSAKKPATEPLELPNSGHTRTGLLRIHAVD